MQVMAALPSWLQSIGSALTYPAAMSTFGDCAAIRPVIWAACHHCRRATRYDPRDPLIADRNTGVHFRCRCGRRFNASYADPRGHKGVPPESWVIVELSRPASAGPAF